MIVTFVLIPSNAGQQSFCETCYRYNNLADPEPKHIEKFGGDLTIQEAKELRERVSAGKGTPNDFLRLREANNVLGIKLNGPSKKSNRVAGLPEQLQRRVKLSKETKNKILENAVYSDDKGEWRFIDQLTGDFIKGEKVTNVNGVLIKGNYDFGHVDGDKAWKDYQDNKENWKKTRDKIIEDQDNPDKYRLEDQKPNRSNGAKKGN